MNLFRSEEDVKAWVGYDPVSEEAIMPVVDWAEAFSGPLFRERMSPDIFANMRSYFPLFFKTLAEKGRKGGFWLPD